MRYASPYSASDRSQHAPHEWCDKCKVVIWLSGRWRGVGGVVATDRRHPHLFFQKSPRSFRLRHLVQNFCAPLPPSSSAGGLGVL